LRCRSSSSFSFSNLTWITPNTVKTAEIIIRIGKTNNNILFTAINPPEGLYAGKKQKSRPGSLQMAARPSISMMPLQDTDHPEPLIDFIISHIPVITKSCKKKL
jgi:hypothetical protein